MADASSEIPALDKMNGPNLKAHLEAEIAKWGPVIKKAGIYAD
jgi:tripartite-type tricarboxylate transporter receptor subunit TctC